MPQCQIDILCFATLELISVVNILTSLAVQKHAKHISRHFPLQSARQFFSLLFFSSYFFCSFRAFLGLKKILLLFPIQGRVHVNASDPHIFLILLFRHFCSEIIPHRQIFLTCFFLFFECCTGRHVGLQFALLLVIFI